MLAVWMDSTETPRDALRDARGLGLAEREGVFGAEVGALRPLSLIHISEPTRPY